MESMENTGNGAANTTQQEGSQGQNQESKTFTQEEVNRIVQERLARAKAGNEPSDKELELQQREAAIYAREQIVEKGLPVDLYNSLKGLDKETVDKCIQIVAPYIKKASEPILNAVGPTSNVDAGSDAIRKAMGLK